MARKNNPKPRKHAKGNRGSYAKPVIIIPSQRKNPEKTIKPLVQPSSKYFYCKAKLLAFEILQREKKERLL